MRNGIVKHIQRDFIDTEVGCLLNFHLERHTRLLHLLHFYSPLIHDIFILKKVLKMIS